jgi:hypothetical protein
VLADALREGALELGIRVVHLVADAEGLQSSESKAPTPSTDRVVYIFEDLDRFFGAESASYSAARAQLTALLDELNRCERQLYSTYYA